MLFPTWHRAYVLRLENALRSIEGCEHVTLPYWDETGDDTQVNGVPGVFLMQKFPLNGELIDNPLYSYQFPQNIVNNAELDAKTGKPSNVYTKYKSYKTVRYPYSGLMGTPEYQASSEKYNASIAPEEGATRLNENVKQWLNNREADPDKGRPVMLIGIRQKYKNCLKAPNYTTFSNMTSAQAWNDIHDTSEQVTTLESPHNDMHLAVGGFELPDSPEEKLSDHPGPNGDMGENDTAGLDPIFFFHHCCVDRFFWLWQQNNERWPREDPDDKRKTKQGITNTKEFNITDEFPGTNSVDAQGPTPGIAGGTWLTMDTELQPFRRKDTIPNSQDSGYCTSRDMIDIETHLNYTYEEPASDGRLRAPTPLPHPKTIVKIAGRNRNLISGSHILATYATVNGTTSLVSYQSVLSRWNTSGCANCQSQGELTHHAPLHIDPKEILDKKITFETRLIRRMGVPGSEDAQDRIVPSVVVGKGLPEVAIF